MVLGKTQVTSRELKSSTDNPRRGLRTRIYLGTRAQSSGHQMGTKGAEVSDPRAGNTSGWVPETAGVQPPMQGGALEMINLER